MHDMTIVTAEVKLTGRQLLDQLKAGSATQVALLADDLTSGRVVVDRLTRPQARRLTGCSFGYQNTVAHLAPHERQRVRCGFEKLSEYHNKKTDHQIEIWIRKHGVDRVFAALDRLTSLTSLVAAE
jgi:hypothetical protein